MKNAFIAGSCVRARVLKFIQMNYIMICRYIQHSLITTIIICFRSLPPPLEIGVDLLRWFVMEMSTHGYTLCPMSVLLATPSPANISN